jgi:uncharacterized membrane protein YkgB
MERLKQYISINRDLIFRRFFSFCVGFNYLFFGVLKFYPDLSSAEFISEATIQKLTFGFMDYHGIRIFLALVEVLIGVLITLEVRHKVTFILFMGHMLGTLTPILLFPAYAFKYFPFAPTLEGQYIIKNLVFISGGLYILYPYYFQDDKKEVQDEL